MLKWKFFLPCWLPIMAMSALEKLRGRTCCSTLMQYYTIILKLVRYMKIKGLIYA